jgi:hypothetical protein
MTEKQRLAFCVIRHGTGTGTGMKQHTYSEAYGAGNIIDMQQNHILVLDTD